VNNEPTAVNISSECSIPSTRNGSIDVTFEKKGVADNSLLESIQDNGNPPPSYKNAMLNLCNISSYQINIKTVMISTFIIQSQLKWQMEAMINYYPLQNP
jgi:hypothetical protein